MAHNVVEIIFDQFLEIVERLSKKSCFKFNECSFKYRVRDAVHHRLLDVLYVATDKCDRQREVIVTIDITNICYDDITTCKWVNYLETSAEEFVHDICPAKYVVVKEHVSQCRVEPPRWEPLPCNSTTTIIRKKPVEPEPECEVIVERECECVPECKREKCHSKHTVIIREQEERPWKCGDYSFPVKEHHHEAPKSKCTSGRCGGSH